MTVHARWFGVLAVLVVLLAGCPKSVPATTVAGGDDEQMDQYSSRLEELRTKTGLKCDDYCIWKTKACSLSVNMCAVAQKANDRADFQQKCVSAQEECARFNEGCASCGK